MFAKILVSGDIVLYTYTLRLAINRKKGTMEAMLFRNHLIFVLEENDAVGGFICRLGYSAYLAGDAC